MRVPWTPFADPAVTLAPWMAPDVRQGRANEDEEWIAVVRTGPPPNRPSIGTADMFFFYFNKLGWLGSITVSIVLTAVLVLAVRSCSG
jgi:hypothetical protein